MSLGNGVSGVVRGALAGAPGAAPAIAEAEEQLDLVALLPPSTAPAGRQEKAREQVLAAHRARGAGRPPGATNLATRQAKDFILKVFGDPLVESGRWLLHTPDSLAIVLDCSKAEAFDRLQRIREELLPYFYARLAPVDGAGNAVVPFLQLNIGGQGQTPGASLPPWMNDPEVQAAIEKAERKQQVIDGDPSVSHGESRTDAPSD
jgi:hypothetical protein